MVDTILDRQNVDKPLIVRVKRKVAHAAIDALWLEIHERPSKRPLLDLGKLTLSEASSSRVEELKTKKVLVEYAETVNSSTDTIQVLQSFLPELSGKLASKGKFGKGRRNVKSVNKHDQILTKSKQSQQELSINARFEQIWRCRRGKNETSKDKAIHEVCQLYDVVRVDVEEHKAFVQKDKNMDLEESKMLAQYLPLLRDVMPTVASELEHDMSDLAYEKEDGYVYDYYTVKEEVAYMEAEDTSSIPLVQVENDDEFDDGPSEDSDYSSDDTNAEGHPRHDYPDEDIYDDEDEVISSSIDEESDGEIESDEESVSDYDSRTMKIHAEMGPGGQMSYYLEPQSSEHNIGVVIDGTIPSDTSDDEIITSEIHSEHGIGAIDETPLDVSASVEKPDSADVMGAAAYLEPYDDHESYGSYYDSNGGCHDDYDDDAGGYDYYDDAGTYSDDD